MTGYFAGGDWSSLMWGCPTWCEASGSSGGSISIQGRHSSLRTQFCPLPASLPQWALSLAGAARAPTTWPPTQGTAPTGAAPAQAVLSLQVLSTCFMACFATARAGSTNVSLAIRSTAWGPLDANVSFGPLCLSSECISQTQFTCGNIYLTGAQRGFGRLVGVFFWWRLWDDLPALCSCLFRGLWGFAQALRIGAMWSVVTRSPISPSLARELHEKSKIKKNRSRL